MKITANTVIETAYNLGDKVTVKEIGSNKPETSRFYLDEKDENGFNKSEIREKVYTVDDIELSVATGHVRYSLHYSDPRCIFPSGYRGATEEQIIRKVE